MNSILYRIHTEDRDNLALIANHYFPGFTILQGIGYYKSTPEPAAVIEVYGTEDDRVEIGKLARAIATVNEQTSVLVAEFGRDGIGVTEHGPEVRVINTDNVIDFPSRRAA